MIIIYSPASPWFFLECDFTEFSENLVTVGMINRVRMRGNLQIIEYREWNIEKFLEKLIMKAKAVLEDGVGAALDWD